MCSISIALNSFQSFFFYPLYIIYLILKQANKQTQKPCDEDRGELLSSFY